MVGGGFVEGAEAEQRLEAGERGAAAVVSEDELVKVDLEVFRRDPVVGALQPGLEVGERPVGARQHPFAVGEALMLDVWLVVEAGSAEGAVAGPTIGVDDSPGGDSGADEGGERARGRIGQQLQPQAPGAVAAYLDRNPDERLAVALAAAAEVGVAAAQVALVETSTSSVSGSRSGATIARRSLCRIVHAVS